MTTHRKIGIITDALVLMILLQLPLACNRIDHYLKRGDALVESGLWEEALGEFEQAEEQDPDNPEIQRRIQDIKKILADEENKTGLRLLALMDSMGAIESFKSAIVLNPKIPAYRQNLKKAVKMRITEAQTALESKKFAEAFSIYDQISRQLPDLELIKKGKHKAQVAYCAQLLEKADTYYDHGLYGNALINLVIIKNLVGQVGESATLLDNTRQKLRQAAMLVVDVRAGKVPKKWIRTNSRFIQRLRRLELPECQQDPTPGPKTSGKITVKAAVKKVDFEASREKQQGEQKYQSGTRPVDNPAYLEAIETIKKGQEKIEVLEQEISKQLEEQDQLRQQFADSGPEDNSSQMRTDLKKLEKDIQNKRQDMQSTSDQVYQTRRSLSRIPRKLKEPVYDMFRFPIFEVTRTVQLQATLSAARKGHSLLRRQSIRAQTSTKDTTHRARARYRVKLDPLEFPKSDDELIDEAVEQAVSESKKHMEGLCKSWKSEILKKARQARSDSAMQAIENYVLFLFMSEQEPPDDLVKFLKEQKQFEDISSLRPAK